VRRQPDQVARVAELRPEVVCLQEVTPTTLPRWIAGLRQIGLEHALAGDPSTAQAQGRSRPLLVLTAAVMPLSGQEVPGAPWPERVAAARTETGVQIVNVHSPISPKPNLVKVRTHEAVHAYVSRARPPVVLCGDLNTPRKEHPDGRVWTFARTQHGKLRPDRGERWDRAELALIKGLEPLGFRDAFRELHGLDVREYSWEWPRWGGGYRLDHLIVSGDVRAPQVEYLHEWRRGGLSDHSPLVADIRLRGP
jgi:endonuclease/exonuclease/phosphatase family metal-dependent hydrolase